MSRAALPFTGASAARAVPLVAAASSVDMGVTEVMAGCFFVSKFFSVLLIGLVFA